HALGERRRIRGEAVHFPIPSNELRHSAPLHFLAARDCPGKPTPLQPARGLLVRFAVDLAAPLRRHGGGNGGGQGKQHHGG
ncbi:MAG TPA: hypothetical protein VME47_05980, partial [Acetobacteraceae bacterium]|nr:hypothetical protein [Acetobacteraceae bacterium]